MLPLLLGLIILSSVPSVVPNIPTASVVILSNVALFGYAVFVFHPVLGALRLGTVALCMLGLVRSYGYLYEGIWSPAGVWLIVFSLALLSHFNLRKEVMNL